MAAAYRHFDHPAGARFKVSGKVKPIVPLRDLHPAGPGTVRQAQRAGHPRGGLPVAPAGRAGTRRPWSSGPARGRSCPRPGVCRGGALVGDTTAGKPRPIRFPQDLLRRHHLYVARTRMGKSTLMHHIVSHKLREKAEGRDGDAIIVVDPHADLVSGILEQVPESLIDKIRLIDLADQSRRSRASTCWTPASSPTATAPPTRWCRVAKGLWEQWGPRMQSILEQTVKTLHEANEHPETDQGSQHTILDGLKLLSDNKVPHRGPEEGGGPLPAGVVGEGLRRLAQPVPGRGTGPGADPPLLLRIVQARPGHPGPEPLHHRPAGDHSRRRHPAGVHRPGRRGPGRGRPGGGVPA